MKKVLSVILACMLLVTFASADVEFTDWTVSTTDGSGIEANDDGLPKLTGTAAADFTTSAIYNNKLAVEDIDLTVKIHSVGSGSWFGIGFKDAAKGLLEQTVAGFGNGLFIICQYLPDLDYLTMIFYSVDANGFATPTATLGVISNGTFSSGDTINIKISPDETLGYVISLNEEPIKVNEETGIDLNFLKDYFTDDECYVALGTYSSGAADAFEVLNIEKQDDNPDNSSTDGGNAETSDNLAFFVVAALVSAAALTFALKAKKVRA